MKTKKLYNLRSLLLTLILVLLPISVRVKAQQGLLNTTWSDETGTRAEQSSKSSPEVHGLTQRPDTLSEVTDITDSCWGANYEK